MPPWAQIFIQQLHPLLKIWWMSAFLCGAEYHMGFSPRVRVANVWIPRARDFNSGLMHLWRQDWCVKQDSTFNVTVLKYQSSVIKTNQYKMGKNYNDMLLSSARRCYCGINSHMLPSYHIKPLLTTWIFFSNIGSLWFHRKQNFLKNRSFLKAELFISIGLLVLLFKTAFMWKRSLKGWQSCPSMV